MSSKEEAEEEALDPRIQEELEKLNKASEDINKLELELDEARSSFRQVLTESTQRLNALAKKLGSCIEKARPYYEARMKAKEAQLETQKAALRFERACSQQAAAKEMVFLAEQGFFKKGQPFDPAWQEMLNHATMKVNDAERERLEAEIEHQRTAHIFNDCEQRVKELQRQLKRNITKSRPYFEQKARFNQQMEEQKRRVGLLETSVTAAKQRYSQALQELEAISDEIHQQRKEAKLRKQMGTRGSGVGAETPDPPHDGHRQGLGIGDSADYQLPKLRRSSSMQENKRDPPRHPRPSSFTPSLPASLSLTAIKDQEAYAELQELQDAARKTSPERDPLSQVIVVEEMTSTSATRGSSIGGHSAATKSETSEVAASVDLLTPGSDLSSVGPSQKSSPDQENIDSEVDPESTRTNAEIMESLQRAKVLKSPLEFLRPNRRSREDLLDEMGSDTESLTGSMASVSVLDDEAIENLMMETGDYVSFLAHHSEALQDGAGSKLLTLPAKLSYLQEYMHFNPEWVERQERLQESKRTGLHNKEDDLETNGQGHSTASSGYNRSLSENDASIISPSKRTLRSQAIAIPVPFSSKKDTERRTQPIEQHPEAKATPLTPSKQKAKSVLTASPATFHPLLEPSSQGVATVASKGDWQRGSSK